MIIGVPKEVKTLENRVAMTPAGVEALVGRGHTVLVEEDAGVGSGLDNQRYINAGAEMVDVQKAWAANMVIKVKEPIPTEYKYLRDDLLLFTYLHLAAEQRLTTALLDAGTTAIAYETVQTDNGQLPLLTPIERSGGTNGNPGGCSLP